MVYIHTTQAEHLTGSSFSGDAAGDGLGGVYARVGRAADPRRGAGTAGGRRDTDRGLTFTRYYFSPSRLRTNQSAVHSSGPPALPTLRHYYCTTIA